MPRNNKAVGRWMVIKHHSQTSRCETQQTVYPWKRTNIPWKLMLERWNVLKKGPSSGGHVHFLSWKKHLLSKHYISGIALQKFLSKWKSRFFPKKCQKLLTLAHILGGWIGGKTISWSPRAVGLHLKFTTHVVFWPHCKGGISRNSSRLLGEFFANIKKMIQLWVHPAISYSEFKQRPALCWFWECICKNSFGIYSSTCNSEGP